LPRLDGLVLVGGQAMILREEAARPQWGEGRRLPARMGTIDCAQGVALSHDL
jgi:hypothetical protein